MPNHGAGVVKSGRDRLIEFVLEHWLSMLYGLVTGVGLWTAYLTKPLAKYAPLSWVVAALALGLIAALTALVVAWAGWSLSRWRFTKRLTETAAINPLDGRFERKRIRVSDFFAPYGEPIVAASFIKCELVGPGAIYLRNGQVPGTRFESCEIVIVRPGATIIGGTVFEHPTFHECVFVGVTLLLLPHHYDGLRAVLGDSTPPVISNDGASPSLTQAALQLPQPSKHGQ